MQMGGGEIKKVREGMAGVVGFGAGFSFLGREGRNDIVWVWWFGAW
jgi:hypothetical protein